jgi:hypothetical protein
MGGSNTEAAQDFLFAAVQIGCESRERDTFGSGGNSVGINDSRIGRPIPNNLESRMPWADDGRLR